LLTNANRGFFHAEITDSGGRRSYARTEAHEIHEKGLANEVWRRRSPGPAANRKHHRRQDRALGYHERAQSQWEGRQRPGPGFRLSALATMPPDALAKLTIEDLTLLYSAFEAAGAAFLSIYNVPACDAAPAAVSLIKDEMDRCDWTLEHIANDLEKRQAK
jgi:hypothetical protein